MHQLISFLQKLDKLNKPNHPPVLVDLDVKLTKSATYIVEITDEVLTNILD